MRMRNPWGLLALAAVAAVSATPSSSARVARPSLVLLQRAPVLVVQGSHFQPREVVGLTAASSDSSAATTVTTTRQGRFVARFARFAVPECVRVVVRAGGRRGDRATLTIDPKPGATGIPCGL